MTFACYFFSSVTCTVVLYIDVTGLSCKGIGECMHNAFHSAMCRRQHRVIQFRSIQIDSPIDKEREREREREKGRKGGGEGEEEKEKERREEICNIN